MRKFAARSWYVGNAGHSRMARGASGMDPTKFFFLFIEQKALFEKKKKTFNLKVVMVTG